MSVTKKLINSPEDVVDECLMGLCYAHPGLKILKGHRVVVRSDYLEVKRKGKVALLSGGGSGHEPAHAGYVGPGMLTAAVAGAVFTSPPPNDCLAAIRVIGKENPAGVLIIIKNYTGDRLNFGFAAEKAKAEGIKVEMFVVAEDKALDVTDKAVGHRGLCGALMIHKIAGAMAESEKSLEDIVSTLTRVSKGLATIGLGLSPCSLPGRGPTFHLNENEMELGLGIHGEAGVKRLPLASAKDAVEIMIDHLSRKFEVEGDEATFGIIVNNLGGLSCLELNVVVKEVVSLLRSRGAIVARVLTGSLMTSLEMAGVSITLLRVDDDLLKLLDEPTKAPAWPTIYDVQSSFCKRHEDSVFIEDASSSVATSESSRIFTTQNVNAAKLNDKNTALVKVAIEKVCATLIDNEEKLNALDSESGDGDCGTTHSRMAKAILAARPNLSHSCPSALLGQLAHLAQEAMGGSSGAVYSLGLMAGSKSLEAMVTVDAWARALDAAMAAVTFYGKAEIGDRTLLDALHPIWAVLRKSELRSLQEILDVASAAAMEGAMATKNMVAKAGRATYVARDRQDQPDPGAFAVFLWIQAVAEASRSIV